MKLKYLTHFLLCLFLSFNALGQSEDAKKSITDQVINKLVQMMEEIKKLAGKDEPQKAPPEMPAPPEEEAMPQDQLTPPEEEAMPQTEAQSEESAAIPNEEPAKLDELPPVEGPAQEPALPPSSASPSSSSEMNNAGNIPIVYDGKAIMRENTLKDGCYYGDGESSSDHAPVVYENQNLEKKDLEQQDLEQQGLETLVTKGVGTWNIGSPLSHFQIVSDDKGVKHTFFGHKFHTDKEGNLINRKGDKVGIFGNSEVFLLKRKTETGDRGYAAVTNHYVLRLGRIIESIKQIFKENPNMDKMVLQEIPSSFQKTRAGENIHKLMKEFLRDNAGGPQELFITFFDLKTPKVPTQAKLVQENDKVPDVAYIRRAGLPAPKIPEADYTNRFVPFCAFNKANKVNECTVAVHMPYAATDKELLLRCTDMANLSARLMKKGNKALYFIGDFNTSAERMSSVCKEVLVSQFADFTFHSVKEGGSSCSTNDGDLTPRQIDVMLEVTKKK